MDPSETFKLLLEAIESGEVEEAKEHAENLAEWVAKGGYLPSRLVEARAL